MSTFLKFNCFAQDVGQKVHNLNSDNLNVMLTNTAPAASNSHLTDLTEIATGNGYSTGGLQATGNAYTQTSGVAKLTAGNVTITATGSIGPFRYAVLYNATASGKNLIAWWDYASSITLNSSDTFTVSFDPTNGVLQLS